MNTKSVLLTLLVGQMVMQGFPIATIDFFKHCFGILSDDKGVELKKMSNTALITRQNASKHAHRLAKAGYLEQGYRSWRLSKNSITDKDLLLLIGNTGLAA